MHAPLHKLPALPSPQRSRSRRERRCDAARKPVMHVVMPGMEVARAEIKPRETIAAFLRRTGWATKDKVYGWQFKRGLPTVLEVNGESILRKNWRSTRIAANDNVRFVSFPLGGSGSSGAKQVIGLVALIAVAAFATAVTGGLAAGLLGSAFAAGSIGAYALGAAIGIGGALLVNALVAPKSGATNNPNATQDQIYSVQAAGNTAKLGQPLPVWYGRIKSFPEFAATPWGEFVGNDQYLNVLLSPTMGSLDYEALYIDDTVLWNPADGVSATFPDAQVAFYEPGAEVTLFPTNVDQSSEVTGQQLPDGVNILGGQYVGGGAVSPGDWLGPFAAGPSGTLTQSIAVDFVFPGGCYTADQANADTIGYANIGLTAEYCPIDDAGTPTGPMAALFSLSRQYASRTPIRDTIKVDVTPGRYAVQFRREDHSLQDSRGVTVAVWAGLRSFLKGNNSFPDVSTVAIRLKASQSTQGSFKFGVLGTRTLPVWNGSAFVTQATRNNAWALLDAVTNSQYGSSLPISKVDFNAVVAHAAGCDTRGDTFDYRFSSAVAIPDALDKILTASRARHFWLGDTVSIVRDEWRDVPTMLLTDREIVRDSTQVTWTMLGDEDPDAVIVEYVDQNTWLPAQVQYPPNSDSFTAVNAEVKRIDGIINRDQAFRECAFYYLQSIYRRENVQIGTEYEGRAITFGSVIRVQSELPMAYGYGGAVVGVSGHALTLNPAPVWDAGPFYIRLRMPNGTFFGPVLATQGAGATIANLDASSLAAAETAQSTTLAGVLAREDGGEYPSFELGTADSQSKLCVVLNGVPNGELCTLNLVVDDERVHATDLGNPPVLPSPNYPFNDKVPLVIGLNAVFGQGTAEPKLSASWFPTAGAVYYIADVSFDSGQTWQQVYEGLGNSFDQVVTLAALKLRVQAVNGTVRGPYSSVDIEAPTIIIANNTVALSSVIAGIKEKLTTAIDQVQALGNRIDQLTSSLAAEIAARNWLDKKQTRSELSSVFGTASARITEVMTVATGTALALAQTEVELTAEIDGANARIDTTNTVLVDSDNVLAARIDTLTTQTNGSFAAVNNEIVAQSSSISSLAAQQTTFTTTLNGHTASLQLLASSVNGNSISLGLIGTIDGVTGGLILTGVGQNGVVSFGLLFRGDVIIDGSITAGKLNVGALSAITENVGVLTAGIIRSTSGKVVFDLNAGTLIISD